MPQIRKVKNNKKTPTLKKPNQNKNKQTNKPQPAKKTKGK